jgi:taurine transport system permease protein
MRALERAWGIYVRAGTRWPVIKTLVPFVPLLVLWWAVAAAEMFPRVFFPSPVDVAHSFWNLLYKGILTAYLYDSVMRLATGAAMGVAIAIPLGVLIGLSDTAHRAFWPILLFFQAIGDIAWLPILIIWFGFGLVTMTFVIVYTVVFPMVLNTVLGVRSIPEPMYRAAQSLGASRIRIVTEVVLPGSLPNIITGLRNGLGYGWRALIAAEIIVGTSGIGFMMFDARRAGSVVEVVVGLIVLGVLWYIVDSWVLAPIERATGERWGLVSR